LTGGHEAKRGAATFTLRLHSIPVGHLEQKRQKKGN